MKHLLIVFHTQSGNTGRLAKAAAEGAAREAQAVQTRLVTAADAGLTDLLWADAVLLGTPENFGFMSGMLKDFFEQDAVDLAMNVAIEIAIGTRQLLANHRRYCSVAAGAADG